MIAAMTVKSRVCSILSIPVAATMSLALLRLGNSASATGHHLAHTSRRSHQKYNRTNSHLVVHDHSVVSTTRLRHLHRLALAAPRARAASLAKRSVTAVTHVRAAHAAHTTHTCVDIVYRLHIPLVVHTRLLAACKLRALCLSCRLLLHSHCSLSRHPARRPRCRHQHPEAVVFQCHHAHHCGTRKICRRRAMLTQTCTGAILTQAAPASHQCGAQTSWCTIVMYTVRMVAT